ncbi:MAG: HAD family hydrolase [Christensenellaceae bacterium]|nr:HAD family hydrolase [Christensenellaceae bacterium]
MPLTTVLFDLDGTLLPMDQDIFVKDYFKRLAARIAPLGYDPKKLIDAVWRGTGAMIENTGKKTNEDVFWDVFASVFGEDARRDEAQFKKFYEEEFDKVREVCGYDPHAAETVRALKEKGYRVVLATNPIFPAIATQKRIRWAGMEPEEFELITTYENISFCKPNPDYYREILSRIGAAAEECIMVGNDVGDDMVAEEIGMKVFLLPACLINKAEVDINRYPHGGFAELMEYIEKQ